MNKINISIVQDPNSNMLIGVLHIYGFESFKTNMYLLIMEIKFASAIFHETVVVFSQCLQISISSMCGSHRDSVRIREACCLNIIIFFCKIS